MKKKYISPETTLIKLHTENVMGNLSSVGVSSTDNKITIDYDISKYGMGIWDGTSQPETAKDNDGFTIWDDED